MRRQLLLAAALLAGVAGCAAPKLEIREVGSQHVAQKGETTSGRVALGMSQLAMGNVGLALESFRRAVREDPNSHQALLGLAECYLQMGKPALARRSVEQALALRPDVPHLYRALAAAAEGEGKPLEAAQLRKEAELRTIAPAAPPPPPAAPATPAAPAAVAIARPKPPQAMPPASTVTVDLTLEPLRYKGPRMVRLSMGEVALVTKPDSPFGHVVERAGDTTIHAPLRILNAARVEGIAARTRKLLAAKGAGAADIGDAPRRQGHSELRFAAGDSDRARKVAAKLPFKVMLVERDGPMVLLVGRNAAP